MENDLRDVLETDIAKRGLGYNMPTANVDGNYDKRGLPDPLVLAFYFTAQSDLIVQLIILRNRYDI